MIKIICDNCGEEIKKVVGNLKKDTGIQAGKKHICYKCLDKKFEFEKFDKAFK